MSRYILDGVPTAMRQDERITGSRVTCACGWAVDVREGWAIHDLRDLERRNALRFHYTNCPLAEWRPDTVGSAADHEPRDQEA